MQTEEKAARLSTTRLLMNLFSAPSSTLATTHRSLWLSVLKRCGGLATLGRPTGAYFTSSFRDFDSDVRGECVAQAKFFLVHQPTLREDVQRELKERILDPEEAIRLATLQVGARTACGRFRDPSWIAGHL
jgi:hypothetical protein